MESQNSNVSDNQSTKESSTTVSSNKKSCAESVKSIHSNICDKLKATSNKVESLGIAQKQVNIFSATLFVIALILIGGLLFGFSNKPQVKELPYKNINIEFWLSLYWLGLNENPSYTLFMKEHLKDYFIGSKLLSSLFYTTCACGQFTQENYKSALIQAKEEWEKSQKSNLDHKILSLQLAKKNSKAIECARNLNKLCKNIYICDPEQDYPKRVEALNQLMENTEMKTFEALHNEALSIISTK